MSLHVIEGTWDEIERHKAEFVGRQLRVTFKPEEPKERTAKLSKRPSALGKYAFVAGGSEAFANEKQAEIAREDRAR